MTITQNDGPAGRSNGEDPVVGRSSHFAAHRRLLATVGGASKRRTTFIALALVLTAGVLLTSVIGFDSLEEAAYRGDLSQRLLPLGSEGHLLGTDGQGRDILARVVVGARFTFGIAALANLIAAGIGIPFGLLGVIGSPRTRAFVARVVDFSLAFPGLVLAIVMVGLLGRGNVVLAVALGLFSWPLYARVTFGEGRGVEVRQYVTAARLFGVSKPRLVLRHILPGIAPTLAVVTAFQFADLLISAAGLAFLGLGPPLGTPEWGTMLSDARGDLTRAWWILIGPGLAIAWSVILANLIGDETARATRAHRRSALG